MKTFKLRYLILSLVAVFALVLAPSSPAFAAKAKSKPAKTVTDRSNGLKISPVRTDLSILPGKTKTIDIQVTNLKDKPVTLSPIENDFVAGGEDGHPALILDEKSYAPTHSLKRFMMPLKDFTIGANATKVMKLQINVPPSAQPGGYFGALRFAPTGPGSQPLSLASSVASLVLMTVPGPTTHELVLTNFDIQRDGEGGGKLFSNSKNLNLMVRFQNRGNVQEGPFGQIQVTKGKDLLYSYNFNQKNPKEMVLPDSARRWNVPLKNLGSFGKYTVHGTFSYNNGQAIDVSKTFWIIPTSYIIGAVIAILILIILFFVIRAFLRSYKRKVLRESRRRI